MPTKILLAVKDDTQNHCMITSARIKILSARLQLRFFFFRLVRFQSAMSTQKLNGHVYIQELSVFQQSNPNVLDSLVWLA